MVKRQRGIATTAVILGSLIFILGSLAVGLSVSQLTNSNYSQDTRSQASTTCVGKPESDCENTNGCNWTVTTSSCVGLSESACSTTDGCTVEKADNWVTCSGPPPCNSSANCAPENMTSSCVVFTNSSTCGTYSGCTWNPAHCTGPMGCSGKPQASCTEMCAWSSSQSCTGTYVSGQRCTGPGGLVREYEGCTGTRVSGGSCSGTPTAYCRTETEDQCGLNGQTCEPDMNGGHCYVAPSTDPNYCNTVGEARCNDDGSWRQQCSVSHVWQNQVNCAHGCSDGNCQDAPAPTPSPTPNPTPFCRTDTEDQCGLNGQTCIEDLNGGHCSTTPVCNSPGASCCVDPQEYSTYCNNSLVTSNDDPTQCVCQFAKTADYQPCSENSQCQSNNCQIAPGGKFCLPEGNSVITQKKLGEECGTNTYNQECETNLICNSGHKCVQPKPNYESCNYPEDCISNNCQPAPGGKFCFLAGYIPITKVSAGGTCGSTAYDRQCVDGYTCKSNKCVTISSTISVSDYETQAQYQNEAGLATTAYELYGRDMCNRFPNSQECKAYTEWEKEIARNSAIGTVTLAAVATSPIWAPAVGAAGSAVWGLAEGNLASVPLAAQIYGTIMAESAPAWLLTAGTTGVAATGIYGTYASIQACQADPGSMECASVIAAGQLGLLDDAANLLNPGLRQINAVRETSSSINNNILPPKYYRMHKTMTANNPETIDLKNHIQKTADLIKSGRYGQAINILSDEDEAMKLGIELELVDRIVPDSIPENLTDNQVDRVTMLDPSSQRSGKITLCSWLRPYGSCQKVPPKIEQNQAITSLEEYIHEFQYRNLKLSGIDPTTTNKLGISVPNSPLPENMKEYSVIQYMYEDLNLDIPEWFFLRHSREPLKKALNIAN